MKKRWLGLVLAAALVGPAATAPSEPAAQTHWEAYRNWDRAPSSDQRLEDSILIGAIDLHAHHAPDAYPRQWDAFQVADLAAERGQRPEHLPTDQRVDRGALRTPGLRSRGGASEPVDDRMGELLHSGPGQSRLRGDRSARHPAVASMALP